MKTKKIASLLPVTEMKNLEITVPKTKKVVPKKKELNGSSPQNSKTILENGEKVQQIELSLIDLNPFNPRKYHNEAELNELAISIEHYGVIQPITLRPKSRSKRFEIVCGERRYRSCKIAGKKDIPAIVKPYSNDEAMEITIIENLQRKDISPIEEAYSFSQLIELRKYSIQDLSIQFGKSDSYIRTRLQLRNLIEEVELMVVNDEISLTNALEISKYNKEIQKDVYSKHLDEDGYYCWRKLNLNDFKSRLESNYSADLNKYAFDKTECLSCPFNSATFDLFAADKECGKCQNFDCMQKKQNEYIVKSTMEIASKEEKIEVCVTPYSNPTTELTDKIKDIGYEVKSSRPNYFPVAPEKPNKKDFASKDEYQNAKDNYGAEMAEFSEEMDKIQHAITEGNAVKVIDISNNTPKMGYRYLKTEEEKEENPIDKLKEQDKRYKEIAFEKTIEDVKKFIRGKDIGEPTFAELEENLLLYIMLKSLHSNHHKSLGIKNVYNEDERATKVLKLTDEQKNIIKRDFIISQISETFKAGRQSDLLLEFVTLHFPDDVAGIKKVYYDVYEKRHDTIKKRIGELKSIAKSIKSDEKKDNELPPMDIIMTETSILPMDNLNDLETDKEPYTGEIVPQNEVIEELAIV